MDIAKFGSLLENVVSNLLVFAILASSVSTSVCFFFPLLCLLLILHVICDRDSNHLGSVLDVLDDVCNHGRHDLCVTWLVKIFAAFLSKVT